MKSRIMNKILIICLIAAIASIVLCSFSIKNYKIEINLKDGKLNSLEKEIAIMKKENQKTFILPKPIINNSDDLNKLKIENAELKKTIADMNAQTIKLKTILASNTMPRQRGSARIRGHKLIMPDTKPFHSKFTHAAPTPKRAYDPSFIGSILTQISTAKTTEEKINLLKSLNEMELQNDPSIVKMVNDALNDPNPEVAQAALKLLEGNNSSEAFDVIAKALQTGDEETRMSAAKLLKGDNPMIASLINQTINDTSESVRSTGMDMLDLRPDSEQIPILQSSLNSPYLDVKQKAAEACFSRSDQEGLEMLIEALKDTDSDFRKDVASSISSLVDKEFTSYDEARKWWDKNKMKYTADLSPID